MARNGSTDGVTRFENFLRENRLKPACVARKAGCSRQHLLRIRNGFATPRINLAVRLVVACGDLLDRRVSLADLFDIGTD